MSVDAPPDNPTPPVDPPQRVRPRVRKRRLLVLLIPLTALAAISTVFGMMMAVASDLPQLENREEYKNAQNSILYDVRGRELGVLANNQNRIIVKSGDIAPVMKSAVVAIEDQRFYENSGVDLRGMARAFFQDVVQGGAVQGGSTITQQFVKNALRAQNRRTVFEKLREAALAYHLTRKWPKDKILTEYLNAIYFGNGAYGIESAARTYFGNDPNHLGCGTPGHTPCASQLKPHEAALLAGIIASPSGYDPLAHPQAALARRNLVLQKMFEQERLTQAEYQQAVRQSLPSPSDLQPPGLDSKTPYFASWVRQQLVDRYGARRAFEGGLKVTTTIDEDMQAAAERAVNTYLADPSGPTASIVMIDNATGEVRAMVGGRDYQKAPFNLATQGQRQPGSSMKPFILATALSEGTSPDSVWTSGPKDFIVPHSGGKEHFIVHNFENRYSGALTLAQALTYSDNTVYADVGIHAGTRNVARMAKRMGIRTPISTNYAMTLGGLKTGVTPLDMAHAYATIARGGTRINGTLGAPRGGPVGIRRVSLLHGGDVLDENHARTKRVLSPNVAAEMQQIMSTVVTSGTAKRAQLDGVVVAGKTGTTENYGDAWFVGFTKKYTVAVWVGYPDGNRSMATNFEGGPVEGGTFPAQIWHDFMVSALQIDADRAARRNDGKQPTDTTSTDSSGSGLSSSGGSGSGGGSGSSGGGSGSSGGGSGGGGGKGGSTGGGNSGGGGGSTGGGSTGGGGGSTGGGGNSGGGGSTGGGGGGSTGGGNTGGDGGSSGGGTGGAGAPTG